MLDWDLDQIILCSDSGQLIATRLIRVRERRPFVVQWRVEALSGDVWMWIWSEYEFVVPRIKILRRTPCSALATLAPSVQSRGSRDRSPCSHCAKGDLIRSIDSTL